MAATSIDRCNSVMEWKQKSKIELKKKIKSNLERRGAKLAEIVNKTMRDIVVGNTQLRVYSAQPLVSASLDDIFSRVDDWSGVNIVSLTKKPLTFEQYHKRADNWWNRCKAEWIGDYYFYPFFRDVLDQFITNSTHHCHEPTVHELIYFVIFSNVINAEIHYHRSRPQPLVLDKSYIKSKDLNHLFHKFGVRTCIPWQIPSKTDSVDALCTSLVFCTFNLFIFQNKGNYRNIVRQFAKQWARNLLQDKQVQHNKRIAVLRRNKAINMRIPQTPKSSTNSLHSPRLHHDASNAFFSGHQVDPPYSCTLKQHSVTPPVAHVQHPTHSHVQPSMRYHPYRTQTVADSSPILSAECQIKVYDSECDGYMNSNHNHNHCSSYTCTHSSSANYVMDHWHPLYGIDDADLFGLYHDMDGDNDEFLTI
eukprot:355755_1